MKKKNRKKEFRHNQKDKKVVPFKIVQPYQESFDFGLDWEEEQEIEEQLRLLQEKNPDEMAVLVRQMILDVQKEMSPEEFQLVQKDLGIEDGFLEYLQAMSEKDSRVRLSKLKELVSLYPEEYRFQLGYLAEKNDFFTPESYVEIESFLELTMKEWKNTGYAGYSKEVAVDMLEGCCVIITYYLMTGFYRKALHLVEFVLQKVGMDLPDGFEILVLATFNTNLALEKLVAYAKTLPQDDEIVQLQLVMGYLLAGDFAQAQSLFNHLAAKNISIAALFSAPNWIDVFTGGEIETDYPIGDIDLILESLNLLYPVLSTRLLLQIQLTTFADDYLIDYSPIGLKDMSQAGNLLAETAHYFTLLNAPEMAGIRMDYVRILFHEGDIKKVSDFKKKTEKQLLAIPGIGKGTIEKLKQNGVVFKKSK